MTEREAQLKAFVEFAELYGPRVGTAESHAYGKAIWQASRQQALEEAAVICDQQAGDHEFIFVDFKAAEGCVGCARAIRSLTRTGEKA